MAWNMFSEGSEQLRLAERLAKEFARGELERRKEELESFPPRPGLREVLARAWELGFFSLGHGEEAGDGESLAVLCAVLKNVAAVDAGFAAALFTHIFACRILDEAGRGKAKPPLKPREGSRPCLVAFPVFDRPVEAAKGLRAERCGGDWRLRGEVELLVLGALASYALLPAFLGDEEMVAFFLCPVGGEGWRQGPPVMGLGLRSCPAVDIALQDVVADPVGELGMAEEYFGRAESWLSPAAAALCLGVMEGAWEEAAEYARQRVQGGREIIKWSEVRMMLSSMALACQTVRMLIGQATRELGEMGEGFGLSSRACLLVAQDLVREVTSDGIQVLGGIGYMKDRGQEKRFRDGHHLLSLLGSHPLRRLEFLGQLL